MSAAAIEELQRLLGAKVVTDPDRTSPWSRDQSPVAAVGTPLASRRPRGARWIWRSSPGPKASRKNRASRRRAVSTRSMLRAITSG